MHSLWRICADLLHRLFDPRGTHFTGLWDALRADRACARALLAACASIHTTIIARPVEEWRYEPWQGLWTITASCALVLSEAATDPAALDFTPNPLRRELLVVRAGLERLLSEEASTLVVSGQPFCCRLLVCDARQHFEAWQAEKRAGRGQPYLPPEVLESLGAGVSGHVTVLGLTATPGAQGGVAGGRQLNKPELSALNFSLCRLLWPARKWLESWRRRAPAALAPPRWLQQRLLRPACAWQQCCQSGLQACSAMRQPGQCSSTWPRMRPGS